MPSMPRISKKCANIAYNILGKPAPLMAKKSKRELDIDKTILRTMVPELQLKHV
jgi:hypothetical protein